MAEPRFRTETIAAGEVFVAALGADGASYEDSLQLLRHLIAQRVLAEVKNNRVAAAKRLGLNRNSVSKLARWTP